MSVQLIRRQIEFHTLTTDAQSNNFLLNLLGLVNFNRLWHLSVVGTPISKEDIEVLLGQFGTNGITYALKSASSGNQGNFSLRWFHHNKIRQTLKSTTCGII